MTSPRLFRVHGLDVAISCQTRCLHRQVDEAFDGFAVEAHARPPMARLRLAPFDHDEIGARLPRCAQRVFLNDIECEAWRDGDDWWLIDDRWGAAQINLMRGTCHSWLLGRTSFDAVQCVERAVLWPLAQLLQCRRLHLLPAISLERDGQGVLLLASRGLAAELITLIKGGWNLIGQRWTALAAGPSGIRLMQMPPRIDGTSIVKAFRASMPGSGTRWIDVARGRSDLRTPRSRCRAVAIIAPARLLTAHARQIAPGRAMLQMRRHWPIARLHPSSEIMATLARTARCFEIQLSRRSDDLLALLDTLCPASRREFVEGPEAEKLSADPQPADRLSADPQPAEVQEADLHPADGRGMNMHPAEIISQAAAA